MTRSWLLRLGAPLFAALLVALPRAATAAELDGSARSMGVAPTAESWAKPVLARAEARAAVRLFAPNAFTAPEASALSLYAPVREPDSPESRTPIGTPAAADQPPARAPPALSC